MTRFPARALAASALGLAFTALPAQAAGEVSSFIVKLRDAPAHAQLQPRHADARDHQLAARLAAHEHGRWNKLLGETGLHTGPHTARLRATGRDQQRLDLGRVYSASEAALLQRQLEQHGDVAWAEPNMRERRMQASPIPNDPRYATTAGQLGQWWLQPVSGSNGNLIEARLRGVPGFQTAWQRSTGAASAVVAVLDTGTTAHPELVGRLLPGYDFVSVLEYANDGDGRDADASDPGDWVDAADRLKPEFRTCELEDSSWHGTIIATMLAAATNNGQGVAAMNWAGRVLPVRVAGKCGAEVADIVDGMRWAAGLPVAGVPDNPNPARIINISFGGSAACGSAYQAAIDEIRRERGAMVVAAAGNEWGAPTRPANCLGTVGVVALNRDGFKANYSNFGAALSASGIATVGGDDVDSATKWNGLADSGISTAYNLGTKGPGAGDYARLYGSSFAAPIVSGALSLMLSVNPALTADQLFAGLRLSARPHVLVPKMAACANANPGRCACTTTTCGVGMLDVNQALIYAANPAGYVPPARLGEVIDNADIDGAVLLGADRPANPEPPPPSSSGGGGAFGGLWLLGLALAVAWLAFSRRRA